MHNWFKCTVSYETDAENGMKKKVKEEYLVDAFLIPNVRLES